MGARDVLEMLMWTLGPSVVLTYVWLYYVIMRSPDASDALYAKRLWGVFGDRGFYFWTWFASVWVCVAAFLYLSVWLCFVSDGAELVAHDWVMYPYGLFLGFSALYAPLLVYARPWIVVLDLTCVAASTIALAVWTALYLTDTQEGVTACGLTVWLAVHCTLIDAFLWSYNWCYRPGYWDEDAHWQEVADHY